MSDKNINNTETHIINRGVEFILSGGKKKKPKLFHIVFEKLIFFLKREISVYFEFSIGVNKK